MASSIPTARTNLLATLDALTAPGQGLEGVRVVNVGDWDETGADEIVVLLDERNVSRGWQVVGGGGLRIDETYDLPVHVRTYRTGTDLTAVKTRLYALVTQVEKAVAGHPKNTLSGAVRLAYPSGFEDPQSGPSQDQKVMVAHTTVLIRCEQRIDLSAT